MGFRFSLDTDFNNDGGPTSPPFKAIVLGQRKWIILFGTLTYLISQGALSLNQKWLAFEFSITSESSAVLRTLAAAPVFFFVYALFRSYPYLQKNNAILRSEFQKIELTDADTFSENLQLLEKRRVELDALIDEAHDKIEKATNEANEAADQIDKLSKAFPGALNEELDTQPRNALAAFSPPTDEQRARSSLLYNSRLYNQKKGEVLSLNSALNAQLAEAGDLSSHISRLSEDRSKVIETNKRRWQFYCLTSWIAEIASMAPAALSLIFCARYLLRS